ncbi:cytochrome P450 [Streptomyces sp. NPDC049906]|uniref:bifunctional albaflavenone monooxygenase/terpene synthase n=1 Tax=Streptomyces sp. NPDC049906 TaxID=3155656 RepID=UPI003427EC2C
MTDRRAPATAERRRTAPAAPPFAKGGAPLLGHAWNLVRDPLGFLSGLRASGDLVRIRLGPRQAYAVCDPALVATLLKSPDFAVGGPLWDTMELLIGKGVATSNGQVHRRQRRMIQPAFRAERIAEHARVMEEEARAMAGRWRPGATVDLGEEVFRVAVRIMARSLMHVDSIDERAERLSGSLHTVFGGLYRRMVLSAGPFYRIPLPAHRRFEDALADLHRLVDEIIAERRESATDREDLLTALLAAKDENGEALTEQEVHDQTVSLLVAGAENVASTLMWTFQLLAEHPAEESRIRTEVREVTEGRPIDFGDLPRLSHTRNVITEAMRVRPAVWILTRRAVADSTLGGYRIPAGADIVYSPYAMQRDPRAFVRHLEFDPDRWLPERTPEAGRRAMMPFGTGNRKCPGDHFSMAEMAIVLATIVPRWRFVALRETDAEPRIGITLQPRRLRVRAVPLDGSCPPPRRP